MAGETLGQDDFSQLAEGLKRANADLRRAKEEKEAATGSLQQFLEQQIGGQLPLKGLVSWVGFKTEKGSWMYAPAGSLENPGWQITPGEYTVCAVGEDGFRKEVYVALPGEEEQRRFRIPLDYLRPADQVEIEQARAVQQAAQAAESA